MAVRPQSLSFWKRSPLGLGLAAAGLGVALSSVPAANADARLCRKLEAQLASASGGGSSAKTRKYDAAIARQRDELQRAKSYASNSGCLFGFLGGEQCAAMNIKIGRMEDNLASLQRTRDKMGGGSPRDESRILASIEKNGCRDQRIANRGAPQSRERGASLLERLFGNEPVDDGLGDVPDRSGEQRVSRVLRPDGGLPEPVGTYRTFCVRTCDGYFFPMSPASSQDDFARDQQNCESACPGTDMRIYYRKDEGDDPAQMMSVAGETPYDELPAAFAYRRSATATPQCGCNASMRSYSVVSTTTAGEAQPVTPDTATDATQTSSSVVILQPPSDAPPAVGDADPAAVQRLLRANADPAGTQRKVRVVGPVFLPDPEAAIDLQAPAHAPAP